jgi:hypothetical protein
MTLSRLRAVTKKRKPSRGPVGKPVLGWLFVLGDWKLENGAATLIAARNFTR